MIKTEDIKHYKGKVDFVKLATRTNQNPRIVIQAYAKRNFWGTFLILQNQVTASILKAIY